MTLPRDPTPTPPDDAEPAASTTAPDGTGTPAEDKRALRRRLRAARAARSAEDRYRVASALAVRLGTIPEVAALVAAAGSAADEGNERSGADGDEPRGAGAHVGSGSGAGVVAAYASLGDEPGTEALRSLLALSGVRVLLPVIREDGELDWGWDGDDLRPRDHRLAIPEPAVADLGTGAAGLATARCAVLLVPALAVDPRGYRLGQGGGYYDRLLARVPAVEAGGPLRVAVVHDDEVVAAVPHEPHDRRVDAVLTPTRYTRLP